MTHTLASIYLSIGEYGKALAILEKLGKTDWVLRKINESKVRTSNSLRFKTEKEMIQDFGMGWRREVKFNTDRYMDYLLGRPLNDFVYKKYEGSDFKDWAFKLENIYSNKSIFWYISYEALTPC